MRQRLALEGAVAPYPIELRSPRLQRAPTQCVALNEAFSGMARFKTTHSDPRLMRGSFHEPHHA